MKKYLVEIQSKYGAAVYVNIYPSFFKPFNVFYTHDGRRAQLRKAYKTPGGASRYLEKIAAAWGSDIKKVYTTQAEINEIFRLPWWDLDETPGTAYN